MAKNHSKIDAVFTLMVFCIFAASVFLVIMLSGNIYRNIVDISNNGQNERIALSYIRTKVRNADSAGNIYLGDFNEISAIFLEESLEERTFITLIYLYNGWVHELFHEKGLDFLPEQGIPIIEVDSLRFESDGKTLIHAITDYGSLVINLRSMTESEGF